MLWVYFGLWDMGQVDTALAVCPDQLLHYLLGQFPAIGSAACCRHSSLCPPGSTSLTVVCWGGHLGHQV